MEPNASRLLIFEIIDLKIGDTLLTFTVTKPTMEEWLNASPEDIIQMGIPNWNPKEHCDDFWMEPCYTQEKDGTFHMDTWECDTQWLNNEHCVDPSDGI